MANRLSGKQRAARIPLDYFMKPDRLTKAKLSLSFLALVAAVGWWASGLRPSRSNLFAESDSARMRYSHGPVAEVHAPWDARCEACHADFRPIGEDAWTTKVGLDSRAAEGKCQGCHKVEDHHASMISSEVVTCAGCHRDHRGREASLVSLADSDCTSCHGNLAAHVRPGAKAEGFENVTSFPAGHKEFALFRDPAQAPIDPGTLKFNHALHMAPGLTVDPLSKPVKTVGDLPDSASRNRYAPGKDPKDSVQLECASCHRLEPASNPSLALKSGVEAAASVPLPGTGAYMKPISYQLDCAACHGLEVNMARGRETETIRVPHRQQPNVLHKFLMNTSIGLSLEKDAKLLDKLTDSSRPLPGERSAAERAAKVEIEERVVRAERALFGAGKNTCTECHSFDTGKEIRDSPDPATPFEESVIQPTYVKSIWFEHARFDHLSHRAVSCRECHPAAYFEAGSKTMSRTSADVMLPTMATCATCHAPPSRGPQGEAIGGAGHSCTECHRYHGGDRKPGQEMAKDVDALDIRRFLDGAARPK